MRTAHMMVAKYQTSSPSKLAECLDINIHYMEMPRAATSLYVPLSFSNEIVINKRITECRQRFYLAYSIGVHIKEHSPTLCAYEHGLQFHIMPFVFALELLKLDGEYGNKPVDQYYLENGCHPQLIIPIFEKLSEVVGVS